MRSNNLIKRIIDFYLDGFRNLPDWGVRVWVIILLKLFIIFIVLRLLFFPDLLKRDFETDSERSLFILEQLTSNT